MAKPGAFKGRVAPDDIDVPGTEFIGPLDNDFNKRREADIHASERATSYQQTLPGLEIQTYFQYQISVCCSLGGNSHWYSVTSLNVNSYFDPA
jgi:hypothetical protein